MSDRFSRDPGLISVSPVLLGALAHAGLSFAEFVQAVERTCPTKPGGMHKDFRTPADPPTINASVMTDAAKLIGWEAEAPYVSGSWSTLPQCGHWLNASAVIVPGAFRWYGQGGHPEIGIPGLLPATVMSAVVGMPLNQAVGHPALAATRSRVVSSRRDDSLTYLRLTPHVVQVDHDGNLVHDPGPRED